MTPKQNMLETIRWGNPEYVPLSSLASVGVGMPIINMIIARLSSAMKYCLPSICCIQTRLPLTQIDIQPHTLF